MSGELNPGRRTRRYLEDRQDGDGTKSVAEILAATGHQEDADRLNQTLIETGVIEAVAEVTPVDFGTNQLQVSQEETPLSVRENVVDIADAPSKKRRAAKIVLVGTTAAILAGTLASCSDDGPSAETPGDIPTATETFRYSGQKAVDAYGNPGELPQYDFGHAYDIYGGGVDGSAEDMIFKSAGNSEQTASKLILLGYPEDAAGGPGAPSIDDIVVRDETGKITDITDGAAFAERVNTYATTLWNNTQPEATQAQKDEAEAAVDWLEKTLREAQKSIETISGPYASEGLLDNNSLEFQDYVEDLDGDSDVLWVTVNGRTVGFRAECGWQVWLQREAYVPPAPVYYETFTPQEVTTFTYEEENTFVPVVHEQPAPNVVIPAPNIQVPNFQFPNIQFPNIQFPNIKFPTIPGTPGTPNTPGTPVVPNQKNPNADPGPQGNAPQGSGLNADPGPGALQAVAPSQPGPTFNTEPVGPANVPDLGGLGGGTPDVGTPPSLGTDFGGSTPTVNAGDVGTVGI